MTLDEARKIVEALSAKLDEDARIIWGAQIYKYMDRTIRTMLIVTGVKSAQILGRTNKTDDSRKQMEHQLGIEFLS